MSETVLTPPRNRWLPILVVIVLVSAVANIGAYLTDVNEWYLALNQPGWKPPDWAFAPGWSLIFAFIAASASYAWLRAPDGYSRRLVVVLFVIFGLLNILWSYLFFTLKHPDWALIEVGYLWLSILLPLVLIYRFSPRASLLLIPALAWLTFASALNWAVVKLNPVFSCVF